MAVSDLTNAPDDDRDLLALIEDGIAQSTCFDNEAVSDGNAVGTIGAGDGSREQAIEYYKGIMRDLPPEDGWSSAISRDVSDTIDQQMPGLMRVFAGTSDIVEYQPGRPGEEPQAKQASDYVNYVWANECNGYEALYTGVMDALQVRNGIMKAYWDETPEFDTEDLHGLDETQVSMIVGDPECQIIAHGMLQQSIQDPMSGQAVPTTLYSLRVRHTVSTGRLVVECVPPEDFGIDSSAHTLEKARFVWHRTRPTRSELIERGYDKETVEDLSPYIPMNETAQERNPNAILTQSNTFDKSLDIIEVFECYLMVDLDKDGVAERRKVVVAGGFGARSILSNEPWPDDLPFADLKAQIVPHRWMGKSTADDVMDIQRIKTTLLRQGLNNLYQVNNPRPAVRVDALDNPDDILRPTVGSPIRLNAKGGSINDALQWQVVPYIGDKVIAGMQVQDSIIQKRTGITPATAALDETALDPQTATAEQIDHDAGYARTELTARTISHGLQTLFQKVLRIIVRNQDRVRTLRLNGAWVDFDPRAWNAGMNCTVKVGLGTGSRERDLSMLAGVGKQQDQIIAQLGPANPIVTPQQYVATRQKMVEASGLRDPDQYFTPITNDQFSQWQQSQPPKPDPAMEKVKAQAASDQAKQQGHMQIQAAKQQSEAQTAQIKAASELEVQKAKLAQEYALKLKEIEMEAQLKAAQLAIGVHQANETQVAAPQ